MSDEQKKDDSPLQDPLLRDVPIVDGHRFLDPVALDARIGEGGMGAVYRGMHRDLGIMVAVKCLKTESALKARQASERFNREARLTAQLSHQNLVRLYEFRQAHGLAYLVLEYVEGENARALVRRKGALAESKALRIVLSAARGLSVAHQHPEKIVHRDIKPENILISRDGKVKLADLGLAKAMERVDASTLATDGMVGTPKYMAPEQWNSDLRATPQTDVWALGATLYFLLTGEDGVRGNTFTEICGEAQSGFFPDPRGIKPELSAGVAALVADCTRLEPNLRPADATELARRLQALLTENKAAPESVPVWRQPRSLVGFGIAVVVVTLSLWRPWETKGLVNARLSQGPPPPAHSGFLDPATNRRIPDRDWEILDATDGYGNWAKRVREPRSGIEFVLIPPGEFLMGSPQDEPGRGRFEAQHQVLLSRPFYMAVFETTWEQACRIDGIDIPDYLQPNHPCIEDWMKARDLCNKIGCELPTEAQWERAARAGSNDAYWWGQDPETGIGKCNVLDQSWVDNRGRSSEGSFKFMDGYSGRSPVGHFQPNAFGLYDMIGNVWEWCLDEYVDNYELLGNVDPWAPPDGEYRVLRGGSYDTIPSRARVAMRFPKSSDFQREDFGFRAVRQLP